MSWGKLVGWFLNWLRLLWLLWLFIRLSGLDFRLRLWLWLSFVMFRFRFRLRLGLGFGLWFVMLGSVMFRLVVLRLMMFRFEML